MLIFEGESLEKYKRENLEMQDSWNQRNFVSFARTYLKGSTEKILAIGGLRGTGKTVGILQAAEGMDTVYVLAQQNDGTTGKEYLSFLEETDKKMCNF